jgi:hypothetical protein
VNVTKPLDPRAIHRLLLALVAMCKAARGEKAMIELEVMDGALADLTYDAVCATVLGQVNEEHRHLFQIDCRSRLPTTIRVIFHAPATPAAPPAATGG